MFGLLESTYKRKIDIEASSSTSKQSRPATTASATFPVTPLDSSATNSPAPRASSPIEIDEAEITMATPAEFQPVPTWNKVKELLITSTEFTSRDKKEILAQSATFEGLTVLKELAAVEKEEAKKLVITNMYSQAAKQLALYYLVGTYGWTTAINTLKSDESSSLGVPQPVYKPSSNIIYVKSNGHSSNHAYSNTHSKKKGRQPYRKK